MIVLGRIVAPYGVQGWVRVHAFGDDPEAWQKMKNLWLSADADAAGGDWAVRELSGFRRHGNGYIAKLRGADTRSAAEALEGLYVAAPREALPAPEQDEYYWADLVGLEVVNLQQDVLGRVASLIETGANQVLVVKDDGRERLLPFVASVVAGIDLASRRIRVDWGSDW